MRTLIFTFFLLLTIGLQPVIAQKKAAKAVAREQEFIAVEKLIDSQHFRIEINQVYPQSGHDVSRFNPSGSIVLTDSIAKGNLPFFGRAYSLPYGEDGGIEFEGPVKDRKVKVVQKRKEKIISYRFSVNGKNDIYKFDISITSNGNCSIHLISNNRSQISYAGKVEALPEKETKKQKATEKEESVVIKCFGK